MQNFLNPKLLPKIKCDSVYSDYHSPENLISDNVQQQSLGFMTYLSKPPINLTFELICKIELHSICIWSELGSFKSTAFDVYCKDDKTTTTTTADSTDTENDNQKFLNIGRCYKLSEKEQGVQFSLSNENSIPNLKSAKLFRHRDNPLKNIKVIKLTIKNTLHRREAVIKRIEIWGTPSRCVSNDILQFITNKLNGTSGEMLATSFTHSNNETSANIVMNNTNTITVNDDLHIPEEYLDVITYEIMQCPMVLPSGKIIDQSTIDRHNKCEINWGRLPSDPFTGQIFTANRKPIFDASLKTRIDSFLLTNSNHIEIKKLPRRLGSVQTGINNKMQQASNALEHYQSSSKRIKLSTDNNGKTTSLDEAVENALKNIQRFSQMKCSPNLISTVDTSITVCFKCLSSIGNGGSSSSSSSSSNCNFYKTDSCQLHVICRNCLLNTDDGNQNICQCGSNFNNFTVYKYNKSNN